MRVMRIDIKEKQRRSLFRKKAACGSGEFRGVHATSSAIIVARNIPGKGGTITQWFIRNSFFSNKSQCIGFFSEKKITSIFHLKRRESFARMVKSEYI